MTLSRPFAPLAVALAFALALSSLSACSSGDLSGSAGGAEGEAAEEAAAPEGLSEDQRVGAGSMGELQAEGGAIFDAAAFVESQRSLVSLSGKVTTESGRPLSCLALELSNGQRALTDAAGAYRFLVQPGSAYTITPKPLGNDRQTMSTLNVQPFVNVITEQGAGLSLLHIAAADVNGDGAVNLLDIDGFTGLMSSAREDGRIQGVWRFLPAAENRVGGIDISALPALPGSIDVPSVSADVVGLDFHANFGHDLSDSASTTFDCAALDSAPPPAAATSVQVSQQELGLRIPDGEWLEHAFDVAESGAIADMSVRVGIEHDHVGDLVLVLVHPDGTYAILRQQTGGDADDILETYGKAGVPVPALAAFEGKTMAGAWALVVLDQRRGDEGTLESLEIVLDR